MRYQKMMKIGLFGLLIMSLLFLTGCFGFFTDWFAPLPAPPHEITADASPDQTVEPNTLVTLDGSASHNPYYRPLTFQWAQTAGPEVALCDPAAMKPTFTPAETGTYTFQLKVIVGKTVSDPDYVIITVVPNHPPSAHAGPDQTVGVGNLVTLDGSASSDPDGDPLTFLWTQVAGPTVALLNPTTVNPTFTPTVAGILTFQLVVNDGRVNSAPDVATIIVNAPPVADAGPDQTVDVGNLVTLDGSASSDPDGDPLTFSWTFVTGPAAVTLSDSTAMNPTFTPPVAGTYTFRLVVNDERVDSAPDYVDIIVNTPPVAHAGLDQTAEPNTLVTLDGSASSDPDGDPLTFSWTFVTGPAAVTLSDSTAMKPTFTPTAAGTYTFRLVVNDGRLNSTADTVSIAVNMPPTATITAPADGTIFTEEDVIIFEGSATDLEDGDLTGDDLVWTSDIEGRIGTGTSFTRTLLRGTHTITLTATDSHGAQGTDSITIIVDQEVTFPDPNLEKVIRDAIDKPSGPIFRADLIGLTSLNAWGRGISDPTGIEYLTDLTWLRLGGNQISDITPLTGLTKLTVLCLGRNLITDITPLTGLTGLTWLYLGSNLITDITPLAGLTKLTWLCLGWNQITDITPLAGLTDLTWLRLGFNHLITDITPLTGLTKLTELWLGWNQITDITPLTGLTKLTRLWLGGNLITDITPLTGLTDLTWLMLGGNLISDIAPLTGLTKLTELMLGVNLISDITPLTGLTKLTDLGLSVNQITDLAPLVANTGLGAGDEVDLRGNPLDPATSPGHIATLRGRGVKVYL